MYTTTNSSWIYAVAALVVGLALMFVLCVCYPVLPARTKQGIVDRLAARKVGRSAYKDALSSIRTARK